MLNQSSLLSSLALRFFPTHPHCTFPFFAAVIYSLSQRCLRRLPGSTKGKGRALGLEYSLSVQGYVRLGMTGSHSSYHSVQAAARMALSLTQLYFMPDSAKRKIMSAAAHLCLMFSAYAGSPSVEGAAVKSI